MKPHKLLKLVYKAVEDEPELPGEMPDEMWEKIRNNRSVCTFAMQLIVKETKRGILKRISDEYEKAVKP